MMAKETIFVVGETNLEEDGYLGVIDTEGNPIKVSPKRKHLFPLFEQNKGRAIKIKWDNYKGRDYVADAELFDGKPPAEQQIEPITAGVEKPQPTRSQEIAEMMFWKEAGELYRMWKKHPETMPDKPWAKAISRAYLVKMLETLPIKTLDKEV